MKCPESIEELAELERMLPLCRKSLYDARQAKLASGHAYTKTEAERQLAEELERPLETIRTALPFDSSSQPKMGKIMRKITPETSLKRAAVQLLKIHRIPTWPYPGGVMGTRGFPDRVGICKDGRFLAIEFKAKGRKLSEYQENIRREIEAAGGLYIVCRSLDDLYEKLNLPGRLW